MNGRLPEFQAFYETWLSTCQNIAGSNLTKYKKAKDKGREFEKLWASMLKPLTPAGCELTEQQRLPGLGTRGMYKWDMCVARGKLLPFDWGTIVALWEVKAHGFFNYAAIDRLKAQFEFAKRKNPDVRLFYVTFRETNTYDKQVRDRLGDRLACCYYRLTDSGNGLQATPRRRFPEEWSRLENNL